ncbi:hypothetical protein ACU686_22010 [Yinghuangia aomiensis]
MDPADFVRGGNIADWKMVGSKVLAGIADGSEFGPWVVVDPETRRTLGGGRFGQCRASGTAYDKPRKTTARAASTTSSARTVGCAARPGSCCARTPRRRPRARRPRRTGPVPLGLGLVHRGHVRFRKTARTAGWWCRRLPASDSSTAPPSTTSPPTRTARRGSRSSTPPAPDPSPSPSATAGPTSSPPTTTANRTAPSSAPRCTSSATRAAAKPWPPGTRHAVSTSATSPFTTTAASR